MPTPSSSSVLVADRSRIAIQLGVPTRVVEMLQERNVLVHFELSDHEIRESVWQAHVRWALTKAKRRSRGLAL